LLALVAAIVISAEAFLRDPVRLVVALVLVVLAVMAGWTALVRRGTWRLVAGGVALVALVAVVVLIAAGSLVRTVVLIGLVLMSMATARVALGHDLAEVPADLRPVERARHGVLVMNPRSGGGKAERLGLEAEARRRGITPVVLHPGDDLRALAERAVNEGADVLAWLAATAPTRWSRTSPGRTTLPWSSCPPGPATTSRSILASTGPTSLARWTPSTRPWSVGSISA
jgi:hypothetical protein